MNAFLSKPLKKGKSKVPLRPQKVYWMTKTYFSWSHVIANDVQPSPNPQSIMNIHADPQSCFFYCNPVLFFTLGTIHIFSHLQVDTLYYCIQNLLGSAHVSYKSSCANFFTYIDSCDCILFMIAFIMVLTFFCNPTAFFGWTGYKPADMQW